ncbi:MAG: DUF5132 domain-containing protein [Desulfobacteraceae bacterium]|nr:DUF5132 domain-containing protein [Desulfobacteraceae bacterium]
MKLYKVGSAVAIGVAVVAALPVVAAVAKPIAKKAVKEGLLFYEKTKIFVAETIEDMEDLAAEAKSEAAGMKSEKTEETVKEES